jgi:hypothetical protein
LNLKKTKSLKRVNASDNNEYRCRIQRPFAVSFFNLA